MSSARADQLVLIVVFDGLRPDFVRADWTPYLWALRQRGVWFSRSHCVFPAVTRVNASALGTGSFPGRHGVESNTIWRPDVDPTRPLRTSERADLLRLRDARGRLLAPPTLGEVVAEHGLGMVVVGTGSAGAATLLHPEAEATGGRVLHYDFSVPASLGDEVAAVLGPWDDGTSALAYEQAALRRVRYGARALAEHLLPRYHPAVALFWCTVPDGPHHRYGLDDPRAVVALQEADSAVAAMVEHACSLYEALNVFITADHGYITVGGHIDVADELVAAGLKHSPDSTDVVVCADGGAVPIYTGKGRDPAAIARFVASRPWASVVFSAGGCVEGTLPLEATGGGPNVPDLLLCLAWDNTANRHGIAGSGWGGGAVPIGAGDHGGLSPWEMRNTLIAVGPAFREGLASATPCGIVDVAPTALRLLSLPVPSVWDGRALDEALRDGGPVPEAETTELAARLETAAGPVTYTLTLDAAGGVRYPVAAAPRRG